MSWSASELGRRLAREVGLGPPAEYSFVDTLCFFCLVFAIPLCSSVYMCLVVDCWEEAALLALVCGVLL